MKYNEFIHLDESFKSVFDLEDDESDERWIYFIPNKKFHEVLSAAIDSVDINNLKKPVWLQGTYGTGKSHATSVIKHLLCDKEIPDTFDLENNQLTSKLNDFRKKNRVFPVVIKGTSNIQDVRRFKSTIQIAVKKALDEKGMKVTVPSEFENMISILEKFPITDDDIKNTELEAYPKEEILPRLMDQESDILIELEDIYVKNGLNPFTQEDVSEWLFKVKEELNEKYGYNSLMIFWDEFTGALDLPNAHAILYEMQHIAEDYHKGLSLFVVSHRKPLDEDLKKILDRFTEKQYTMSHITTYQLMEKSIDKEKEIWVDVKNRFIDKITPIIKIISDNQGPYVEKALEDLYPIHPYTSFLATYLAEIIGSTERSIFGFLHDKDVDYGFRSFINRFDVDERYFLTPDYLWDFFEEDFEKSEDPKIGSAIQKYNVFKDIVGAEGEEYLVIFKVILLLNILVKMVQFKGEDPAIPSEDNINNAFVGSIYEDKVNDVLKFIDGHGIINKSPDNIYELTSSALPSNKIASERKKLENTKLLDVLGSKQKEIKEAITKKVNRHTDVTLFNGSISERNLKSTLDKDNSNPAFLHMYLFLCKDSHEFNNIKNTICSIPEKDLLKNKIMIISRAFFEENDFNRYLDYKSTAIVAKQFDQVEDENRNLHNAEMLVDEWVNDIKSKYVVYYLNEENDELEFPDFIRRVNKKLSKSIFDKSFENLRNAQRYPLWKKSSSPAQAEAYLFSKTYSELTNSLKSGNNQSMVILNDKSGNPIVNSHDLEFLDSVPDNHPLKLLQEKVDEKMNKAQEKGSFSLARALNELTEPPYGLYKNKIYFAALSFTLRKYINRLYDFEGHPINEAKMKHKIVSLFDYWDGDTKKEQDLKVRFGSEYEKKLIYLLIAIFDLHMEDEDQSIDSVRWAIHNQWTKPNKIPIWLLNYSNDINPDLKKAISSLFKIVKPIDRDIPDSDIQECYLDLEPVNLDFRLLLKDSYENLYKNLILESFKKVGKDLSDSIPLIIEFIIGEMPEEGYWDKTIVTDNIYSWIINNKPDEEDEEDTGSKDDTEKPVEEEPKTGEEESEDSTDEEDTGSKSTSSIIMDKVKKADANKLKDILIRALEENVEIQLIFDKYLEE